MKKFISIFISIMILTSVVNFNTSNVKADNEEFVAYQVIKTDDGYALDDEIIYNCNSNIDVSVEGNLIVFKDGIDVESISADNISINPFKINGDNVTVNGKQVYFISIIDYSKRTGEMTYNEEKITAKADYFLGIYNDGGNNGQVLLINNSLEDGVEGKETQIDGYYENLFDDNDNIKNYLLVFLNELKFVQIGGTVYSENGDIDFGGDETKAKFDDQNSPFFVDDQNNYVLDMSKLSFDSHLSLFIDFEFGSSIKGDQLYIRGLYYTGPNTYGTNDFAEIYDSYAPIRQDYNFAVFYGQDYYSDQSSTNDALTLTSEMISVSGAQYEIFDENKIRFKGNSLSDSLTIKYQGKEFVIKSCLPDYALYKTNTRSADSLITNINFDDLTGQDYTCYLIWDKYLPNFKQASVFIPGPENQGYDYFQILGEVSSNNNEAYIQIKFTNPADLKEKNEIGIEIQNDEFNYGFMVGINNDNGNNQNSIKINNRDYNKFVYGQDNNLKNLYVSCGNSGIDFNSIVNYLENNNINHKNIVVDVNEQTSVDNNKYFVEGYYFKIDRTIKVNVRYSENDDIENKNIALTAINDIPVKWYFDFMYSNESDRDNNYQYIERHFNVFGLTQQNTLGNAYRRGANGSEVPTVGLFDISKFQNNRIRIEGISNCGDEIAIAKECDEIDFIVENYNVPQTLTAEGLQDAILKNASYSGRVIKLESNTYTLTNDLVLVNRSTNSGGNQSWDYSSDVLIDLNGSTLNMEANHIYVEGYSTIHLCNGTINGNGSSLIENYGSLNIKNISINYTGNNVAVVNRNANLNTFENCSITSSNDGICMKDDNRSTDKMFNNVSLNCNLTANHDGIVVNEHNSKFTYSINLTPYVGRTAVASDFKLEAGNIGIYAKDKANIEVKGGTNNGNIARPIIEAKNPFYVSGGELKLDCPATYIATLQGEPIVKVDTENQKTQKINILVSFYSLFESKGSIIKEVGSKNTIEKIEVTAEGGTTGSYFNYPVAFNPFEVGNQTNIVVEQGRFSTNVSNLLNGVLYATREITVDNKTYYEVYANDTFNNDENFVYDNNKLYEENMAYLQNLFDSAKVKNININTNIPKIEGKETTILVRRDKSLNIGKDVEVRNIRFKSELTNSTYIFSIRSEGSIINDNLETVLIEDNPGMTNLNGRFINNSASEGSAAIVFHGGRFGTSDISKPVYYKGYHALLVDVSNNVENNYFAQLSHDVIGTSGVAVKVNNVPIEEHRDSSIFGDNGVNIQGSIDINHGSFVLMNGSVTVQSGSAFNVNNNSVLTIQKSSTVNGADAAVTIDGNSTVHFQGGAVSARDVVVYNCANINDRPIIAFHNKVFASANGGQIIRVNNQSGQALYNSDGRIRIDTIHIEGGFYNLDLNKDSFFNLYLPMNQGSITAGEYVCEQYAPLSDKYPYFVTYRFDKDKQSQNYNGNGFVDKLEEDNIVEADDNQLNNIYDADENERVKVYLIAQSSDNASSYNNAKKVYNLSVNKVSENKNVESLAETYDYQFITFKIDTKSFPKGIKNIYIEHKHGNDRPYSIPKMSASDVNEMLNGTKEKSECYCVNENTSKLTVVTRKFSDFVFYEGNKEIAESLSLEELNEKLAINYLSEKYSLDSGYEVAALNGTQYSILDNEGSIEPGQTYYFRKKATSTIDASDWLMYTIDSRPDSPSKPTIEVSENSAVLTGEFDNLEYSLDGNIWNQLSNNTITGLSANKEYTIKLRTKASNDKFASLETVCDTVKTLKITPVNISIPENLQANDGDLLKEVTLPVGFTWVNENDVVSFYNVAKYCPNEDYVSVEVLVPIAVKDTLEIEGKQVDISTKIETEVTIVDEKMKVILEDKGIEETLKSFTSKENLGRYIVENSNVEQLIQNGINGNKQINFTASSIVNDIPVTDDMKTAISLKKKGENDVIAKCLDISFELKVSVEGDTTTTRIKELTVPQKFIIDLPDELPKTAGELGYDSNYILKYYIIVEHDNNGVKEYYNIETELNSDGTIEFYANKFSLYYLTYRVVEKTQSPSNGSSSYKAPDTGIRFN